MSLRAQIEERNRQWRLFHEWDTKQPHISREPTAIVADLGALLAWYPAELIRSDPDPEKLGIATMRNALALISNK